MSFKIVGKHKDPILSMTLENDLTIQVPINDVAEAGRRRLGRLLEAEFNRIVRETASVERDRIQEGIKSLLGIKGTGRQG